MDAYKNYPQVVIALKNAYHKFLKEGIAPIAASGQFGAPLGSRCASNEQLDDGRRCRRCQHDPITGHNNADNSSLGDVNGMSLPAVLNEVISVTGVYFVPVRPECDVDRRSTQNDGVIPNPLGPDPALRQLAHDRRDGRRRQQLAERRRRRR